MSLLSSQQKFNTIDDSINASKTIVKKKNKILTIDMIIKNTNVFDKIYAIDADKFKQLYNPPDQPYLYEDVVGYYKSESDIIMVLQCMDQYGTRQIMINACDGNYSDISFLFVFSLLVSMYCQFSLCEIKCRVYDNFNSDSEDCKSMLDLYCNRVNINSKYYQCYFFDFCLKFYLF